MNIEKLQKLINSDGRAMSPSLKERIMGNKMNMRDINFIEKSLMSVALMKIKIDLETAVPSFQDAWMRVKDYKVNGEKEVDIDYLLNILSDTADLLVEFQELTDDCGLADVVAVDGPNFN